MKPKTPPKNTKRNAMLAGSAPAESPLEPEKSPDPNPPMSPQGKKIVLIFDESNFPLMQNGKPLSMKFSHDLNLAQFAQASLQAGARVFITTGNYLYEQQLMWEFSNLYPTVACAAEAVSIDREADIVASCGPELLLCKELFPKAKIVAFFAAMHFVESPGIHETAWLYKIAIAMRLHIDFVVTQHERMAQIVRLLGMLTASIDLSERILTCPLGLWTEPSTNAANTDEKAKLGLSDRIVIGNAGGIWRWTDYHTFLPAYIEAVRAGASRLKLFITGLTQPGNMDHHDYAQAIRTLLAENADLVSDDPRSNAPIIFIDDWDKGGRILKRILPVMDVGLNLNNAMTEGWQAYRVRALDYLSHNIPIMNTQGDWLSSNFGDFGFIEVELGNHDSYVAHLMNLNNDKFAIITLRESQRRLANALLFSPRYQALLKNILQRPSRGDKQPESCAPCMYDYARLEARRELHKQLDNTAEILAHNLLKQI